MTVVIIKNDVTCITVFLENIFNKNFTLLTFNFKREYMHLSKTLGI